MKRIQMILHTMPTRVAAKRSERKQAARRLMRGYASLAFFQWSPAALWAAGQRRPFAHATRHPVRGHPQFVGRGVTDRTSVTG